MRRKRTKIGFVGVGRMGANMARRLHDEGYPITAVYDTDKLAAEALAEALGTSPADRLQDVTRAATTILTVVPDDAAMKRIFRSKQDNLLMGAEGRLFINCATLSPKMHVAVEQWAQTAGAATLEACMASSIPQAREGTLYLMVGGARAAFQRARGILQALSQELIYVGEAGKAAEVKALVNMVMNINTAGLAEGLGLGAALGHDPELLRKVFAGTGASSRVLETDGPDMIAREHDCFFSAEHAAKDAGIALKLAKKQKLKLPLASAMLEQYESLKTVGLGGLDKSAVSELTFRERYPKALKKQRSGKKKK